MCWKESGGQAILTFHALLQNKLLEEGRELLNKEYIFDVRPLENVIPFPKKRRKIVSE